jgi:PAS domain S-box-containing protein
MIFAAFFLIVCVTLFSFANVRNMLTEITSKDMASVVDNSRTARELSKVFVDINLLSRTFYGKNDYLESEGRRLVSSVKTITQNTTQPDLNKTLLALSDNLDSFLSQCTEVNAAFYARQSIESETYSVLTRLENIISELLVNLTLEGEDTSFVEQLLTLVIGYRESLLQIGKLYAEVGHEHYFIPLEGKTSPVLEAIDDLTLRLQTITASIPDVALYGEHLVRNVKRYREAIFRFYEVMEELGSRTTDLNNQKNALMAELGSLDREISRTTEHVSKSIRKIIFSSEAAVLILSLIVIVSLGFATTYLMRSNISNPMKVILRGIESFREGNFDTQIELNRKDEWETIEKAFNAMAADLLGSYSALRQSEGRFRELAELLPQPVFELDREGSFTYSNRCGFQVFGYTQDDLEKGVNALQLYVPEERERVKQNIRKRLAGEEFEDHEYIGLRKDGSTFPILVYSAPIIRNSKVVGLRGIVLDITERRRMEEELRKYRDHLEELVEERTAELKRANEQLQDEIAERERAEEALRESETNYRAIVDAFDGLIYVCSQDYRIEFMNEQFIERNGYNATGHLCYKALHDLDSICSWCVNERVFKGEKVRWEVQSPKDNRWYYVVNTPIRHADGTISKQAMIQDITSRKQAEEKLKESYGIINKSPAVAFLWKNEEGWPVEFASENVREIFGYTWEEFKSGEITYEKTIHPDDLARVAGEVARYSSEEGRKSFTHDPYRIVAKDGTLKWLDDRTYIRRNEEGRITHYQGIVLDITERYQLEAQLQHAQKMEAVGTLAGGIAHDFNNLLQAVQGYAELLLLGKKSDDPSYRELQQIVSASKKGVQLTRQLLTFSRKVVGEKQSVNLNDMIVGVKELLERTIPKMIEIDLCLAEKLKITRADPVQLEQLVMNLVVNAVEAMPHGGRLMIETENVTIDEEYCKTHLDASPGDYLLLSVSDTGHGMDRNTLEHIFEPFYSEKEVGQGTGLGLAIVYGIVRSHNGQIKCHSEPGNGTTFKIYLPAVGKDIELKEKAEEEERLFGGIETILVVDDESSIRELGQQILTQFGYKVITAVSGETALEIYRKEAERIDLVILDLIMPGMGGSKCLEKLLKINPQAKVLIATGFLPDEATMKSVEAEAEGFIHKPYDMRQILKAVREVLDGN